jgi:DNA-binding CsgD family transcriptional regulator
VRTTGTKTLALLERERELDLALRSLSELRAGRGQLLVTEAAAGLGKTTLLEAIAREAGAMGVGVLTARGSVLEGEFAFGIVRQWLDQIARWDPDERAAMLNGPARVVAGLMDPGPAPDPSLTDNTFARLHGLYWALANLSAERPLLLVLDDAHWADPASLRFAAFMQPRIHDLPLMLAVGVRPAEPGTRSEIISGLIADPTAQILRPRPLSVEAVAQLSSFDLEAQAAPEFVAACHAATGGNPFYVQMLLAELRADDILPTAENASQVTRIGPRNLARALLLQLAQQPPGTVDLAKALAVLGGEASEEILAAVASVDEPQLGRALDALRHTAVIDPHQLLPRLTHPIVRAAIYGDMGVSERTESHARAAEVLHDHGARAEAVAGQLLLTAALGEAWALETLQAAALEAMARGAPEAAITYFRRALEESVEPRAKAEILAELGSAEAELMAPDCIGHLQAAIETGPDVHWRAGVARRLARALGFRDRVTEAITVLEGVEREVGADDPELALALSNEIIFYGRVDPEGRGMTRERAARMRTQFGDHRVAATPAERLALLNAAAEITMRGESAEEGARLAAEALRDGRMLAEQSLVSPIPVAGVVTLIYCDRVELARRVVDQAIARAVQAGSILGFAHYSVLRAEIHLACGALSDAEADARASLGSVRVPGVRAQQVSVLVRVLVERGEIADAQAVLDQYRMDGELRNAFHVKDLLERRGRLRLAQGRTAEALSDLLHAGESQRAFDMLNPATLAWRSQAALAAHRTGQRDRAMALADDELRRARAFGAPRALGIALTGAALVGGDPGGELLEEALTVLDASSARLEEARALIVRGAWLRRRGERSAARPLLERGLEQARECGALPLAQEATEQLASAGGRPRNVLRRGRDALTPTELRVARLAVEGLSNPEIAQAHFVTLKTVETQLGSCYRKLGIASRRDLERALEGEPE